VKDILSQIGLEPERVQMFNMSAAMAGQFVEATNKMYTQISSLGSNPLKNIKDHPAESGRGNINSKEQPA
jgi:coenzyme F420-reducing hydrogenase delta subunit